MANNIKVVIKVRPLIKREIDDKLQKRWAISENTIYAIEQIGREGTVSFTFDHVFDDESLTQDVYEKVARPIVEAAVEGMNGTIFAYGQTSSGKTYTMMGDSQSPGVIPLAISNIFQTIESKVDRDFLLRVSYIEIYNERIKDLLDVNNPDLKIHEDLNGQVIVKCKEEVTSKPEQVLELMRKGDRNRSTGETQMNERSSRSHSIFIIIIESRRHVSPGEEEENCVNVSQLNLVDLAGSERAAHTGATRQRLREGGHINKSLSTLGNVIRQLSDAQGDPTRFVSFRDSKLTRILQTSLGGNAKTGIICAVTPAVIDETYSTLTFAMCAKVIENKPQVNAVMSDATQIKRLTKEMRTLQEELESKKHLEVDNMRLQEQLALLRDKILMGNSGEPSAAQRAAALRRRTWCAPMRSSLESIPEYNSKLIFPRNQPTDYRLERLSNITERDDDSVLGSRVSSISQGLADSPGSGSGDIICLDDSGEPARCKTPPICSPEHMCFEVHCTPPCVLRHRALTAEKGLKEIEELTKIEKMYSPEKVELIQLANNLRTQQTSIETAKLIAEEECFEIQKEVNVLKESLSQLKSEMEQCNSLRIKAEKETELLRLSNTDWEFKMDNLQMRTQNREKELLNSLKEALEEKERTHSTRRTSLIPQFLNMSQDISLLANSDMESMHEVDSQENTNLQKLLSQKDLDLEQKDKIIAELRESLETRTSEIEAIKLTLKANLDLISSLQAEADEKRYLNSESNENISKLQSAIAHKDLDLADKDKIISNLQELVKRNSIEIEMANSNIDAKSTLIAAMEARAVETCNVFCEQTKQFSELKTLFENISLELESYKSKVQDLTEKNECVPSYIKEISELKELVKRSQEETNTEVESVDLLKLSQLENSLADTKVELANCLQQLAQKDERIRKEFELRSLCEGDNLRIKDDLVNLKTTFENERNILLNDFNTKSSQVDKLTKDLSDSIIQFSSISQINDELQKNIDKVTNDKITVIEGMQQAIKEMERSLQQVTESRDTFKDEYTKIESDKLHLETILNEKSEKISELSILTSTLANEIDNLKLSMNANYQALAQKDEEIASLKMTDENRSTCIEELNQIISQSGQLQKDNQLVITELNALKLENISLGEKLSALQVNLKDQQDCIGKLTDENISLKTELNQAVSQSSQLQQGNELLTAEINSLKAENLSLSENLSLLHISLKDQLENVGSLTNEKLSLKTELNQAVSRSSQLQQGSELLTAEFNSLKAENLSLSENLSLLQISLDDQLENVGSLTNENLSLKTELNQISQSSLENELLTSDLNALRTDNLALNEHANSLQEQLESINKLNEDNSSLKNELNDSIENNKTACAQILVLESGINRIKEDLLNSAKKVESLQSQLEQEMSCRHTTDSHLQSILEELTSIAEYLQEDKYYSTYSITEFSNSSDILQSENSNIMKICKTLASLREHLMAMETLNDEFSELRARQTYNEEFYQSELYKLKGIIDNLNVDLVKSKLNEQGSLESLMNNSISNKENLFKQIESLTPMRKKREEFSSLDCQNITPSYLTSTKKENILPGRTKTPSKNKYEIKKVLDLIINEVISTEVPLKTTTFTPEIPELNIIIHKLGELKMALKASLESNIVLRENIMQLETSNNDLRTILKNTCVTIKELENIQVKYTDSDVTFSSGMIDEYMDLLQRRVMDIISLKTVIQQNLLLEENESTDVVKVTECSASNISAGENRLTEDLSMVKDENEVEIFAFDEISASKVETLDTQQLECLINVLYSKLENAFSLLEIEGNFIQNPEDLHYSETQIEKQMLNLINMHKSLIDELKHTLSVKNHRIQTLEIEISANENDVRELAKAAEELQKKVMCQRSASEVSYAEYSLLNSHYTTVLHRHSRAHSAYVSTTKYMQSRLSNLENVLQNLSLTEDQTMHETTLDDFVTPKKHSDSVYDVVTFNETPKTSRTTVDRSQYVDSEDNCTKTDDQKRMYDDLQSQLNDKCLEIKRLSEKLTGLDSLKLRYQELQLEYDSVSNELIESLQEADSSKDKFISLQKDCMDVIKKSINRDISDEQCDLISLINLYISEVSHQNDKYIKELNLLEDSVKSLKSELHAKEDLIVEYQSKSICNTDFDLKLSSLQGELVTKDSEISNLLTNILELKSSIVDISQRLEASQTENTQIIQQKEILEKKIADFITSESVLKESELLLQQKYEHLAANNSSAQSLIQAYQVEKNDLLSTIKSLEEKCYNESKNSDLLSSNSEKLASLQEELNSRVSDIEALQNTLNTKNSSLVSLTEKCEELSKTLSEKNIELEANQKEFDNRLQLLQQELEDATSQKISLKEEMDSLKREVRSSTDLITQLKEELQVKSDLLLASNSERHNLVAKETIISQNLDELNQKYVDLQTNSQKQEEALKELLKSQHIVSELQSELVKVKDEKSQLSNQIKQLENQIQTYTLQITKSQEALKVSNDDLNTAAHEYNMLTQSTNDLKNEYDNLNKVLNDYRINSEKNEQSLKREVELLQECINQNQINLKEYERRLSESDLLIKKGDSLLETVSLKYESEMAKCEALEKEISDFSVEMKIKEEERCSLLSNTAQLSNMLNEKDQELHTKMEEISQLKTLSRTSASLQFENEKLTMEIKNQAEHIRDLQSKVVSLENSAKIVRELEEKISNLSSHNYILENRVVDLQSELTSSKYNPRHDLHVRRQSLHDLQRCLPQAASPLVPLDDNNDVSMKECDSSEDVAQLKECASRLETQLASLNERYSQLEQVSLQTDVKLKQKTDEYNKISSAYQSIEKKLEELTKINESLSNKPKVDPTVNPDFKGVPMSLFVDKMTHEILAEKFRSLQKSSESLRSRNLEQSAELRRLQHSLQNNTMHNLLPKDGCKPYEKLQEELRIVEQEFRQLKEKEKERDDWETKYKEIDTEYDACVLELKDAVANYNTVCEEKLRVEAELKHLKNKLEEMSEGSPGMEIRRKRQTLHDANRKNNLSTSDKSTNTDYDKSQEKYKSNKELHLQHFSTLDSLKSNEMSKRLEQELKILKEACRRQEDWEAKYKEMDKEYTVCADELRDSVRNYNTVCEEKLQVEAELKHLKNKMEEMKEGSPSAEVRRRRQSLFDTNRGTNLVTSDKTTNTESNEHSRIQRCNHCEHTRPSLPENRCVEAEARLRVPVAIPPILHMPLIPGPGFIQNQKLHEYMQENEILKRSLSKYKGFYIKYRNHKKPPE